MTDLDARPYSNSTSSMTPSGSSVPQLAICGGSGTSIQTQCITRKPSSTKQPTKNWKQQNGGSRRPGSSSSKGGSPLCYMSKSPLLRGEPGAYSDQNGINDDGLDDEDMSKAPICESLALLS